MKLKQNLTLKIFITFFKIGPTTFGGGYAMIPMIEREIVTKMKWMRSQDISDIFAISESIPGAIAINSATFIGYRIAGKKGAVAALLGILIPTFSIVVLLSIGFLYANEHPIIDAAFQGIRPAIVALIIYAAYKIGQTAIYDKTTFIVAICTILLLLLFHVHPVFIIISGIMAGIMLIKIKRTLGIAVRLQKEATANELILNTCSRKCEE